ncbi:MAG: cytochrome c5 family protein [Burkholderiales bacterium]|nr:MAG: cytochrome c5 family protein [Burkholderiales bacterium]
MSSEHEPFIKTPRQLITVVVLAFIVPIIVIVLLASNIGARKRPAAGSDAFTAEAIENRIRPVAGFSLKGADGPKTLRSGEEVYNAVCGACHTAGVANAPKPGDTAAWAPRIKTGYEALLTSALKGKGAMSAQGGGEYEDAEIGRAVVFMANKSGAKFEEPKVAAAAPAAAAPAAAPAAPAAPMPAAAAAAPAAPVAAAAPAPVADAGKALYETACLACHAAGVAGAPKLGDKAAWAPRLALGVDGLTASVIKGKGAMPAKGGSAASDADIKAAVQYMVASVK